MDGKTIVVQPAGRTEDPGARLWQIWLAMLLLGGTLLSFWDSWVDLGISPVIPMCLSLVTMALTLAAGWLRERDRRLSMLQFLPLLVLLGMLTVGSPWRGAKAWIDLMITGWNREQNAGVALFAGQASLSDCLSVACWCSISYNQVCYTRSNYQFIFFRQRCLQMCELRLCDAISNQ